MSHGAPVNPATDTRRLTLPTFRTAQHIVFFGIFFLPIFLCFHAWFVNIDALEREWWGIGPPDWWDHLVWAKEITPETPPNRLFHYLVKLTGFEPLLLAAFAASLKTSLIVIVANLFIDQRHPIWTRYLFGMGLALAMPIMWFTSNTHWFLGQFAPNIIHNPTYMMMAPLALLSWYVFTRKVLTPGRISAPWLVGMTALSALTVYAKPSFHLGFFLAAIIISMMSLWIFRVEGLKASTTRFVQLLLTGILIFLPLAILSVALTQGGGADESVSYNFVIAPLAALNVHFISISGALLASVIFPCVTWWFFRRETGSLFLTSGLILLLSCLLVVGLFAEPGERLIHGNFYWTAYIGVLIAYAEAAGMLSRVLAANKISLAWMIATALFCFHAMFGVLFLAHYYGA